MCRFEEFLQPAAQKLADSPVGSTSISLLGRLKAGWEKQTRKQ